MTDRDDNNLKMPFISDVGFTQVPGFEADDDSMVASMDGDNDGGAHGTAAKSSDCDRNMQSTIDDLHWQSTQMASILQKMRAAPEAGPT